MIFWRLSIRYHSCIFHSCIFRLCCLLLHFPLPHFQRPLCSGTFWTRKKIENYRQCICNSHPKLWLVTANDVKQLKLLNCREMLLAGAISISNLKITVLCYVMTCEWLFFFLSCQLGNALQECDWSLTHAGRVLQWWRDVVKWLELKSSNFEPRQYMRISLPWSKPSKRSR